MALTNADVFIVSDTGGTNYKVTASSLKTFINAGASSGAVVKGFGFAQTSSNTAYVTFTVPSGTTAVILNGSASAGGAGAAAGPDRVTSLSGTSCTVASVGSIPVSFFSYTALG